MNCQKCGIEMERGLLGSHGQIWYTKGYRVASAKNFLGKLVYKRGENVVAWRCPSCRKIEIYTE